MLSFKLTNTFRWKRLSVAVFWIAGLTLGCYLASVTSSVPPSFAHRLSTQQLSALPLLISLLLPLLLSFFAVELRARYLILPIAFFKAFFFGFCGVYLILAFGDAGWLLRRFYMFSGFCTVVIQLWFWIRYIAGDTTQLKVHFHCCTLLIFLACLIDFSIVSPFVKMLFHN